MTQYRSSAVAVMFCLALTTPAQAGDALQQGGPVETTPGATQTPRTALGVKPPRVGVRQAGPLSHVGPNFRPARPSSHLSPHFRLTTQGQRKALGIKR